jgi:hypothetical protein
VAKHVTPPVAAGDGVFTGAQREMIERIRDEDAAKAEPDTYVGKSPAAIEERGAQDAPVRERAADESTNAESRRRITTLEAQLAETNELVQKIARDKGGYTAVAREAAALQAERDRQQVYERIRRNGGLCTIVVHTHEDSAQNFDVPVAVNGQLLLLKRGEPTVVTVMHLEVLDHARVSAWVKEVDDQGNPRLRRHERLSYPYSLLDYSGQRLESLHAA